MPPTPHLPTMYHAHRPPTTLPPLPAFPCRATTTPAATHLPTTCLPHHTCHHLPACSAALRRTACSVVPTIASLPTFACLLLPALPVSRIRVLVVVVVLFSCRVSIPSCPPPFLSLSRHYRAHHPAHTATAHHACRLPTHTCLAPRPLPPHRPPACATLWADTTGPLLPAFPRSHHHPPTYHAFALVNGLVFSKYVWAVVSTFLLAVFRLDKYILALLDLCGHYLAGMDGPFMTGSFSYNCFFLLSTP